jgi:hypothetical protein
MDRRSRVAQRKLFTLAHGQPIFRLVPGEGFSGVLAVVSLFALLGLISLGISDYISRPAPPPPAGPTEAEYRIGSILFVPWTGATNCEVRGFDNVTGQIVADGTIKCDFKPGDQGPQLSTGRAAADARMRAILEAFKK